ncbi:deoxyribonuclease-2-beta-like isoform X2 [Oreochromis aureus]|uniref:deoxyribonuclease-2-beta-like isoform X2 n=1 Tax=Oreochromis aureus TaxID=47969 RepID=UPI0019538515|nr:deoxyribonuclease-2-beta-like isoform X2 [Oreochromis aureus]
MDVLWMIVLTVGLLGSHCEGAISCKNENGFDVDWFILYKNKSGFDYVYIDSTNQNLKKNNKLVNNQAGVLANTLNPYFEKNKQSPHFGFIAYNDQTPSCNALKEYGHSKGVVMMDEDNVVWLLHSTPKFPAGDESNNFYPDTGEKYAQIFMCVTLKSAQSAQIEHNRGKLKDSSTAPQPLPYHENLKSAGGSQFKRFVKQVSKERDPKEGDLYVTIANTLQSNLYIQTWRSEPKDPKKRPLSETEKKKLVTITSVKTAAGEWKHGCDHSKWCVSDSENWMCVGDSNREPSQFERPGGALCINNPSVAEAFRQIINSSVPDADSVSATECDPGPPKRPRVDSTG